MNQAISGFMTHIGEFPVEYISLVVAIQMILFYVKYRPRLFEGKISLYISISVKPISLLIQFGPSGKASEKKFAQECTQRDSLNKSDMKK